jgi:hypothetical protein
MTENELLDELTKELKKEERQPGDVDSYMLSRATGIGRKRCCDILNEKVENGILTKIEIRGARGKLMFVYRKAVK